MHPRFWCTTFIYIRVWPSHLIVSRQAARAGAAGRAAGASHVRFPLFAGNGASLACRCLRWVQDILKARQQDDDNRPRHNTSSRQLSEKESHADADSAYIGLLSCERGGRVLMTTLYWLDAARAPLQEQARETGALLSNDVTQAARGEVYPGPEE